MLNDDETALVERALRFMISGLEGQNDDLELKINIVRNDRVRAALAGLFSQSRQLKLYFDQLVRDHKLNGGEIEKLKRLEATFRQKAEAVRVVYTSKRVTIAQGDALCHHLRTLVNATKPMTAREIIVESSKTYPGVMRKKSQSEAQIGILRDHGLANDPQAGLWVVMPWGIDFDSISPSGLVREVRKVKGVDSTGCEVMIEVQCVRFYAGGYRFSISRDAFRGGSWAWQPHPHTWVGFPKRAPQQSTTTLSTFGKQLFDAAAAAVSSSKTKKRSVPLWTPPRLNA